MTSPSGRSSSLLTRRNKCLLLISSCVLLFFVLLIKGGLFSTVPLYSGDLCILDQIELQSDFDKEKFAGAWYGTFTKGMDNALVATLLEFTDVKVNFVLKDDGDFDIRSVGGKFLGMWCPEGEGHGRASDPDTPEKLSVFFDTPTGKKFGAKPSWVVKTDYTSYGVIYSCWDKTDEGYCKPKGSYAVVLQRQKGALPANKMAEVEGALAKSCINPKAIRPVQHKGHCKKEQKRIMTNEPL